LPSASGESLGPVGGNAVGLSVRSGADVSWRTALLTIGPSPTAALPELDELPDAEPVPAAARR
jgi:hypothetical protein